MNLLEVVGLVKGMKYWEPNEKEVVIHMLAVAFVEGIDEGQRLAKAGRKRQDGLPSDKIDPIIISFVNRKLAGEKITAKDVERALVNAGDVRERARERSLLPMFRMRKPHKRLNRQCVHRKRR
jgi:hypothetical protein